MERHAFAPPQQLGQHVVSLVGRCTDTHCIYIQRLAAMLVSIAVESDCQNGGVFDVATLQCDCSTGFSGPTCRKLPTIRDTCTYCMQRDCDGLLSF